jgi:SRSO17 transposase
MVAIVKLRWRIERDYQELKQAVGRGHYEGRSWRGFHPHATRCSVAYGFLICERETFPPARLAATTKLEKLAVPNNYRSRDSAHSS